MSELTNPANEGEVDGVKWKKTASTPSNNLKEQVAQYISEIGANEHSEKMAEVILNLILDTILASEEMQDEPIADDLSPIVKAAYLASNGTKADLRTMLEGLK